MIGNKFQQPVRGKDRGRENKFNFFGKVGYCSDKSHNDYCVVQK